MYVNLITDIWTNKSMMDFLALGAVLVYPNSEQDILLLGISKMEGAHTAEIIKTVIQKILNKFKFNKNKLNSVVCDEGKNLLKLFKRKDTNECMIDQESDDESKDKTFTIEDLENDSDEDEEEEEEEDDNEDDQEDESDDEIEDNSKNEVIVLNESYINQIKYNNSNRDEASFNVFVNGYDDKDQYDNLTSKI